MQSEIKFYSKEEISKHNKDKDLWIIINGKVYDLSKFGKVHPGGLGVLLPLAGTDCTKQFYALHQEAVLNKYGPKLLIGHVQGETVVETQNRSLISSVPYSESSAFQKGFFSPYYNESHKVFKLAVRDWIYHNIQFHADEWEENGVQPSLEIYKKMASVGLIAAQIYPGPHLIGQKLLGGLDPSQFDYFHEAIVHHEMARIGAPGVVDSLKAGLVIGLPCVLKYAKKHVADQVSNQVLQGEKRICLAISDPDAGSDVAGMTCVAQLSECGKFYIVNGTKKWITNGTFCDYFVTAVRTGKKGMQGISMLLIERSEGLQTKLIKTSYSPAAGTAYITYDNVKVPVDNLLGVENKGFEIIMSNFNHERWMIAACVLGTLRSMIDQCFRWTNQREAFGKKLISQPVIRNKLAHMVAQTEAVEAWFENITYQMNNMNDKQQFKYLGGQIALLKLQTTRTACFVSDNACQIFGGRAITRSGMGMYVERFQKSFKFASIYGGSEEIMADLGIKQAMRNFPENAKL